MHTGKFSALMIEPVMGDRDARLAANLTYVTGWGYAIEVPAGYRSDLASIPKIARLFFERFEFDTAAAAVLHDYLYSTHITPRWMADALFYDALKSLGSPLWKRSLMWAAVRLFGGRGWVADFMEYRRTRELPDA